MACEELYCMECVEGRPVALGLCADCLAGEPLEEVIRQIARLSRELSAALERERRLREALLTLLTAVDRACGTAIPQGSFAAARQAARDAIRAAELSSGT